MNCIVVDDNKMARTAIKQLIAQVDFLKLQKVCTGAVDAFNYLKTNEVDLVFLDVEMPGMTGIELLRNLDKRPIIILVTAKKNYAVEAFELSVADYIIKPVSIARFTRAVSKAKELFDRQQEEKREQEEDKDYIFIRSNSILTKVKSNGIIYVQEADGYVNIHTADKRHTIHSTLKSMEEKLPLNKFYKVHNNYLVAIDRIDHVENNTAHVGRYDLPIAEQYKPGLLQKLNLVNNN
jgi:two-component system LytT family response regulator